MWNLVRFLPLIVGQKVPESNLHWQNFLLLLTIIDIIFAPVLSSNRISYLSMLIEDHHSEFTKLYSCQVTPKLHYMIHYPEWIER